VRFYQEMLEFPLTEIFENRDCKGSNHFFVDIDRYRPRQPPGLLDLPGLDRGPYAEVLGGLHHVAISVDPEKWEKLKVAGIEYLEESGTSICFGEPPARIELIPDPLGGMYGLTVLLRCRAAVAAR
jgi:catechol 2,3-dioxygenase-like lactoylglutathione lyase family enzyme